MLQICSRLASAALTVSIVFSKPKLFSRSSHSFGGEELDDLWLEDIDELFDDKALRKDEIMEVIIQSPDPKEHRHKDEEDPLNANLINEGLELACKLGNHFVLYDPTEE
ncbi:hypothetical protein NPIL_228411 [Nephila pilipes]|uniref:Uncharacterized protein n=1 Tax=Nephila pilipes TaxID=299642 RepID=A0A8X6IA20_NEPPI|nr:hypothetical protein NPIL_107971 [Nephila pilipes]GFT42867.1 hypothetical protein NPIL_228411 [Nephila pilipes]